MVFIATPVELTGFVHYLPYIFRPRAFIGRCLQIKATMQRTATCTVREIDFCSGINGELSKREGERGGKWNSCRISNKIRSIKIELCFNLS